MEHYICTGSCKGVSEAPTKCGDKLCPLYGKDFESCDCTDDKHYGRQDAPIHDSSEESNLL